MRQLTHEVVKKMGNRRVNLHLTDGSVILNVQLLTVLIKNRMVRYRTPLGDNEIALEYLTEIEALTLTLFHPTR